MAEPVSAALTEELLKQAVDLKESPATTHNSYEIENSQFGALMDQNMAMDTNPQTQMSATQLVGDLMQSDKGINAIPANELNLDLSQVKSVEFDQKGGGAVSELLKQVNNSQNNMELLVEKLTSGGEKFSMKEMIQIQVFAHQHTMMFDSMVKFGEMVNSSVNKAFNMQI
ncbi:MAG: hypothetical protein H7A32_04305 [Deltaproteobacteria bacterium]|nr:hypothetical protein [Deltaproteobacteria bacterium]